MFGDGILLNADEKQVIEFMTRSETINHILTAFVEHRALDTLTETIVNPSSSVRIFKNEQSGQLVKLRDEFLKYQDHFLTKAASMQRGERPDPGQDFYNYFLNLGSLHLALDDYTAAAQCFEIAMKYPLENHAFETNSYFELPAILTAVSLELSGQYEAALEVYQRAQAEFEVGEDGRRDIALSINRCQEKLASKLPARAPEYKSAEVNELVHPGDTRDFSKDSLYQRLGIAFDGDALHSYDGFVRSCWDGFNPLENWRLYVDGKQQLDDTELGWLGWERREPSSIKAMDSVFSFIKNYGDEIITQDNIREIHRIAMHGVSGLNGSEGYGSELIRGGEYKTTEVGFLVEAGYNASREGIELLKSRLCIRNFGPRGTFVYECLAEVQPEAVIKQGVVTALDDYYKSLELLKNKEENYLELIALIVDCVQKIEQQQPFSDGNGRTTTALLNILLLQNRLPPVILENPNYFDGYAPEELVGEVLKGMQNFLHVKQHGAYPQGKTTASIIRESIAKSREDSDVSKTLSNQLLQAAASGNAALLQEYLENGMDISIRDPWGNTALHLAAFYGHLDCIQLLVWAKPELLAMKGQDNATPLYLAAHQGHSDVVHYLLQHQANPRSLSVYNMTSSQIAAQRGYIELARILHNAEDRAEMISDASDEAPINKCLFFGYNASASHATLIETILELDRSKRKIDFSLLYKAFTLLDSNSNEILHPVQLRQLLLNMLSKQIDSGLLDVDSAFKFDAKFKEVKALYCLLKTKYASNMEEQGRESTLEHTLIQLFLAKTYTWKRLYHVLHNLDSDNESTPSEEDIAKMLTNPQNGAYIAAFLNNDQFIGKCKDLKIDYPQHCKYILNIIIAHVDVSNRCSDYGKFEQLLSVFNEPEQQARLFDVMMAGAEPKVAQFIKTSFDLMKLLSCCNPKQQSQLINCVLESALLAKACFQDGNDYVRIHSVLKDPEQQARLFDAVMAGTEPKAAQFIKTSFDLVKFFSYCNSNQQSQLVDCVLGSASLFSACLRDVHDLVRMINVCSLFKAPLCARMLADDALLKKVLNGLSQTEKVMELYNDSSMMQNQLLIRMLEVYSSDELKGFIGGNGKLIVAKLTDADNFLIEILNNDELVNKLGFDYLKTWFASPEQQHLINGKSLVTQDVKRGRFDFFSSTTEPDDEEPMPGRHSPRKDL